MGRLGAGELCPIILPMVSTSFIFCFFILFFFLTFVVKRSTVAFLFLCSFSIFSMAFGHLFYSRFLCVEWVFHETKKKLLCMYAFSRLMSLWVPRSERETYTIYFPRVREHAMGLLHARARRCVLRNMGYL